MILGIGTDLCRIDRIRRSVDHFGDAWLDELFTAKEKTWCSSVPDRGLAVAVAFGCKEASAKALGTGFSGTIDPRDIELSSSMEVLLHGGARARLTRMTPSGHTAKFLVSISNTGQFAMSIVWLQAIPEA